MPGASQQGTGVGEAQVINELQSKTQRSKLFSRIEQTGVKDPKGTKLTPRPREKPW